MNLKTLNNDWQSFLEDSHLDVLVNHGMNLEEEPLSKIKEIELINLNITAFQSKGDYGNTLIPTYELQLKLGTSTLEIYTSDLDIFAGSRNMYSLQPDMYCSDVLENVWEYDFSIEAEHFLIQDEEAILLLKKLARAFKLHEKLNSIYLESYSNAIDLKINSYKQLFSNLTEDEYVFSFDKNLHELSYIFINYKNQNKQGESLAILPDFYNYDLPK